MVVTNCNRIKRSITRVGGQQIKRIKAVIYEVIQEVLTELLDGC